jgi:chromate transport protein ChrA
MDKLTTGQPAVDLAGGIAIALLVLSLVALAIWRLARDAARARREHDDLVARELAVIEEKISATPAGVLCVVMIFVVLIWTLQVEGRATTVFQQIEAGVALIAGLILFGLGAALGRRRRYVIYRSEHRKPM